MAAFAEPPVQRSKEQVCVFSRDPDEMSLRSTDALQGSSSYNASPLQRMRRSPTAGSGACPPVNAEKAGKTVMSGRSQNIGIRPKPRTR